MPLIDKELVPSNTWEILSVSRKAAVGLTCYLEVSATPQADTGENV